MIHVDPEGQLGTSALITVTDLTYSPANLPVGRCKVPSTPGRYAAAVPSSKHKQIV